MEMMVDKKNLKRYEAYKDSGVDWLGQIPKHWEVLTLGNLTELKSDKNHPDYEVLSVYRDYGVIPKSSRDDNHNATSLDTSNYKAVNIGDLVVNKMKAWQGSMGISRYKGIVSPAYITCKITSSNIDSGYLHLLLRSYQYIGEYNRISYGVRVGQWDMHFEDFKKVPVLLPTLNEQKQIALYVEKTLLKIDQAIQQKERLIELLQERKQIIIQNAVTHGLNPEVEMKDSGVDWIGKVPAHWEVRRVKYLFSQNKELPDKSDGVVTAFRDGEVTLRSNRRTTGYTIAILEQGYQKVRVGQLVLNSMDAFAGAIGVSDSEGKCSPEYVVCNPMSKNLLPEYFSYLLREMALSKYIEVISNAVRERAIRIRYNNLAKLFLPVPPFKEQIAIVESITTITNNTDYVIKQQQQQIEKLKEYKQILINEVVTGKVKV